MRTFTINSDERSVWITTGSENQILQRGGVFLDTQLTSNKVMIKLASNTRDTVQIIDYDSDNVTINGIDTFADRDALMTALRDVFFLTRAEQTAINDQASSGYMDVGETRMQWGETPAGLAEERTIILPAPYANTTYTVTANAMAAAGDTMAHLVQLHPTAYTTTQFVASAWLLGLSIVKDTTAIAWMAIGLKP